MADETYTSTVPQFAPLGGSLSPAFPGFTGVTDVSFEQTLRHFTVLNSRFPERTTPGANDDAPEPLAFIEWGGESSFYEDDTPSDPVEDLNADGYGVPLPGVSTPSLSAGGVSGGSFEPGSNSGLPGTSYVPVGSGVNITPRSRKPQDKRPGVHVFEEIDRQVQRGLVFNPRDRDDYAIIERILSIRFRGKDGAIMKFNLKPPPFPVSPTKSTSEGTA